MSITGARQPPRALDSGDAVSGSVTSLLGETNENDKRRKHDVAVKNYLISIARLSPSKRVRSLKCPRNFSTLLCLSDVEWDGIFLPTT